VCNLKDTSIVHGINQVCSELAPENDEKNSIIINWQTVYPVTEVILPISPKRAILTPIQIHTNFPTFDRTYCYHTGTLRVEEHTPSLYTS